jgi:hypothetical protein
LAYIFPDALDFSERESVAHIGSRFDDFLDELEAPESAALERAAFWLEALGR